MADLWQECFVPGPEQITPNEFEKTFCRVCRNLSCERSGGTGISWLKRMATQTERLINNPKFADPRDPKFAKLREVDFPSALREAMRQEIGDRRGDWTVPSEADASRLAAAMSKAPLSQVATPTPAAPVPQPLPPPSEVEEDDGEVVGRVLRRHSIAGSGQNTYTVTLIERIVGRPEWLCTCKAFEFGRARPCKHIDYARTLPEEDPPEPEPVAQAPKPTRPVAAPSHFQAEEAPKPPPPSQPPRVANPPGNPKQPFYPTMPNIPMPSGGVMVDGSAPPAPKDREASRGKAAGGVVDPWAPPPPKITTIPVGGKVVLGGRKEPGGKS